MTVHLNVSVPEQVRVLISALVFRVSMLITRKGKTACILNSLFPCAYTKKDRKELNLSMTGL